MVDLIIFDFYGTIIKQDCPEYKVRDGFFELLDFYSDAKKIVFTDANYEAIRDDLAKTRLTNFFDGVFYDSSCSFKSNPDGSKHLIKDLERACNNYKVSKNDAVFIGDSSRGRDRSSAAYCGLKFIQVPQFRNNLPNEFLIDSNVLYEPRDFSFTSLIGKL